VPVVDPKRLEASSMPTPTILEDVVVDGRAVGTIAASVLPAGAKRLEFQFTAFNLRSSSKVRFRHLLEGFDTAWVDAMKNGVPADSRALDPLMERYRDWVSFMWNKPCPPEAFSGLADLHLGHPDFVSRYEAIGEGFSDYHGVTMKAYAKRLA